MSKPVSILILTSASLMLAACGASPTGDEPLVVENGQSPGSIGPAPAEARGQDFISSVLGSYGFAVESARIASQKSARPDVRQFAERLEKELGASADQLKALASAQKLNPVAIPGATDQSDLALLSSRRGDPLDKIFAEQQLRTLSTLVGMLRAYKNGGDDPQLKSWAEANQGRVNDLLLDLQTLNAEIEGSE